MKDAVKKWRRETAIANSRSRREAAQIQAFRVLPRYPSANAILLADKSRSPSPDTLQQ